LGVHDNGLGKHEHSFQVGIVNVHSTVI